MVPVTPAEMLSYRMRELRKVVLASLDEASLASRGLALRLVLPNDLNMDGREHAHLDLPGAISSLAYGGIPAVAQMGFALGAATTAVPDDAVQAFLLASSRIQGRASAGRHHLANDDVAILGIADGLARVRAEGADTAQLIRWLVDLADGQPSGGLWSSRMRALAADLLDYRGRLKIDPGVQDGDALALELCLRRTWPSAFQSIGPPSRVRQQALMADLLLRDLPMLGELDRAAVWIGALRALAGEAAAVLVPGVDEVVRTLKATQGGLKRWVWEQKPGRAQALPARWLIDNEAHVQAFLWATLYPLFGAEIWDEQYLPGYGQLQPRYDFGIASLKLIIEVKLIRAKGDFKKIEEEIAGDAGIYFSDPNRFNKIAAYIYDDCDVHHPELYDGLRNALMARDSRIIDVIIVRRPSMIPGRQQRSEIRAKTLRDSDGSAFITPTQTDSD